MKCINDFYKKSKYGKLNEKIEQSALLNIVQLRKKK